MIDLTFDIVTGVARLAQSTTIKPGGDVLVRVTFSAEPTSMDALQLALGTDETPPVVKAFLDTDGFSQESDIVWTGTLDAADARLVAFMAAKGVATLNAELTAVLGGKTLISPNVSITVQHRVVSGDPTAEGGPTYITAAQIAVLYALLTVAGKYRIKATGELQLWNVTQGKFQTVALSGAVDAEVLTFGAGEN